MNSRSSVKTDLSLSRFSHYNRKSKIKQNQSFDNNCSQSFNFTSHVSLLQKNTPIAKYKDYGKLNCQLNTSSLSQSQKYSDQKQYRSQITNQNTRYANTEFSAVEQQQSDPKSLQSQKSSRKASSPKFKLMVKQPKKNQKPEIIEITLPKDAKKYESSSEANETKSNLMSSQSRKNMPAYYSKLFNEQCQRSLYSQPFENKKYSQISELVPKSQPYDSSILYKKPKKMHSSEINLKTESFTDEELEKTKEMKFTPKNKNFQSDLSFFDAHDQFEHQQPTHFIDLQQLLSEKQKQNNVQVEAIQKREQFSFKPQEQVKDEEVPPKLSKNQFESYQQSKTETFPFIPQKQPVQINLNIKQFVNSSVNSEKTTSSQAFTIQQNQNLSTLTFGKLKKQ